MTEIVAAEGLARFYGQVMGVSDLSARVGPGITGLLGPNGAGKSTFLKLVTGQLRPSRGRIRVLGLEPFANTALYRRLGFCPEADALYDDMTGLEFVTFCLRLHRYAPAAAREAAVRALETVHLAGVMGRRTKTYSKGMRQRVRLAQAFAHGPELLVLDEPMSGLDPVARLETLALLRRLRDEGVHVLISSHILHEIEALTETILLVHRGRILAEGTVAEIRSLLHRHPRKVEIRARRARELGRALLGAGHVVAVRVADGEERLMVETSDVARFERELPAVVARSRPGILSMESVDAGLEAVFDYLVQ